MTLYEPYVLPSILLGIFSLFGCVILNATLPPDTGLYLHGASWFYPSPLGRALGSISGYAGLAFLTAICATAFPYIVYRIAKENGRDPRLAAWGLLAMPAAWYLFAVSIDAIAAMFLVLPFVVKSRKLAILSLTVAALLHLALLPCALAIAGIRYLRGVSAILAVAFCASLTFAYMVATPYGLLVSRHVDFPTFVWTGTATFAVGFFPVILARVFGRQVPMDSLFFTGLLVTLIGGSEAAIQQHFQPRYCMAGALILAAGMAPEASAVYSYVRGARFAKDSSPLSAGIPTMQERG